MAVLESYFFRNKTPFQYFSDVMLPRLMEHRRAARRIRIWCAAAATGQEPYSLAMLIADAGRQLDGWKVDILATDFAEDALVRARKGVYSQFEVQRGLPVAMLVKYFQKVDGGWEIKPEIRAKVVFREHNLLDDYSAFGTFDIIFCRNVLIYFDETLRRAVLARLTGQLASDGYIVLGAAEAGPRFSSDLMAVPDGSHGVYCLTPAAIAERAETMARAREARRNQTPPGGDGGASLSVAGGVRGADDRARDVPVGNACVRAVELDRKSVELLEARAKARGLSVAELLAEFAASENQGRAAAPPLRLKVVS